MPTPIGLRTEYPVAGLANLTDPYPVRGLAMCRKNALVYQGSLRLASIKCEADAARPAATEYVNFKGSIP